jgi:hypothetical protein
VANLPPASITPVTNQIATSVNHTGGKFAAGVNDTSGKYCKQFQAPYTLK